MTIDKITEQQPKDGEKRPLTVQNEIQKDVQKEAVTGTNPQHQIMQLIANVQPIQQVQETARNQLNKGFLDIKI